MEENLIQAVQHKATDLQPRKSLSNGEGKVLWHIRPLPALLFNFHRKQKMLSGLTHCCYPSVPKLAAQPASLECPKAQLYPGYTLQGLLGKLPISYLQLLSPCVGYALCLLYLSYTKIFILHEEDYIIEGNKILVWKAWSGSHNKLSRRKIPVEILQTAGGGNQSASGFSPIFS